MATIKENETNEYTINVSEQELLSLRRKIHRAKIVYHDDYVLYSLILEIDRKGEEIVDRYIDKIIGELNNLYKNVNMKKSMSRIELEFRSLGLTKKVEFIDDNIRYASASAVAEYVETNIYDVLEDVGDKEMIADFLRDHGYKVEKK